MTIGKSFAMTIDGASTPGESAFGVVNPSTGEVFAEAPDCSREQLDLAMNAAQRAFPEWSADESSRVATMHDMATAIEKSVETLARVQTMECGRPFSASLKHLRGRGDRFRQYADLEVPRIVVQDDDDAVIEIVRRPLGVIALIKPWNGPATNVLNAIGPALRAGNTVVFKPSPYTPLSALLIGEIVRDVVPPGVVNVVSGRDPLGQWMVEHPIPRGIGFTGSSATGRKVNEAAARDFKRCLLELGGNDAAIVLDDVDPEELAAQLFWAAFNNNGQVCMAVKRAFVPEIIYDDVANALANLARKVKVGDVFDEETELGPLTNKMQFDRVSELVADALAHGATALAGSHAIERPGYFFEPTILTNLQEGFRIVDEEQFGPVLPLISYRDVDEAVTRANATPYGLGASVWSANSERAAEIAERLDSGTVWINTHQQVTDKAPFGGRKASGLGSQNGIYSVYAFTDPQTVWRSGRELRGRAKGEA
jgi:acyl-CoA reductase-like NAD-dependent aldehyde dehydrogenase